VSVVVGHLWDVDHPYYGTEGNWFAAPASQDPCHYTFDSWADFKTDGIYDADRDMNLVYRWDWVKADPEDLVTIIDLPGDVLQLFIMGQRKAKAWSTFVGVSEADEPEVREWLAVCAKTMAAMWAPLQVES
jgi:hypothetical protein